MVPSRPRVEGEREDEILDATLDAPDRGRLRPAHDGRRREAVARQQGHALPPLGDQGEPRRRRAAARQGAPRTSSSPTPAPCAATCSQPSAAQGAGRPRAHPCPRRRRHRAVQRLRVRRGVPRALHRTRRSRSPAEIYQRAQARGEIRDDVDLELIGPAMAGILLHRAFVLGPPDRRLDRRARGRPRHPPGRAPPGPGPHHPDPVRETQGTPMTRRRHHPGVGDDGTAVHRRARPQPPRLGARPDLGRPADGGARRHHRQHRPAVHPRGPGHQPGEPASGSSPATRWPSAACCCSAAGSATSTDGDGSS